jgi:hypothetical protein
MAPHPFLRPALAELGRFLGGNVEMAFNVNAAHAGLLASTGRGKAAGFAASHRPGFRPLTHKQVHHVETVLKPSIRRQHRGAVRRTRMRTYSS